MRQRERRRRKRWNICGKAGVMLSMRRPLGTFVILVAAAQLVFVAAAQLLFAQRPPAAPVLSRAQVTAALVAAANDRPNHPARYEAKYVAIPYPNGDVRADTGVCADEIVRIYRAAGIDLQQRVHEDMVAAWSDYPHKWGARRPDKNIDHRRVPNLAAFFRRHGAALPVTADAADYAPGDIVTWNLVKGGDLPHIGMVVDQKAPSGRWMVEHNIGGGPQIEDVLFDWQITGHFRYLPR
jgi:uncharacterized protein YijF (DUF1287 family)